MTFELSRTTGHHPENASTQRTDYKKLLKMTDKTNQGILHCERLRVC